MCEAQLEADMTDDQIQKRHRELMTEHAAVLRILDRHVPAAPTVEVDLTPVA
jgi:hypothetical protein